MGDGLQLPSALDGAISQIHMSRGINGISNTAGVDGQTCIALAQHHFSEAILLVQLHSVFCSQKGGAAAVDSGFREVQSGVGSDVGIHPCVPATS